MQRNSQPTKNECLAHDITSRLIHIQKAVREAQKRMPVFSDSIIVHDILDEAIDYIDKLSEKVYKRLVED
jgi:hypothetical protein